MTEQTAMLLVEDVESGHVQTVAEPRAFPRRGVAVAAGLLGMTAAVTMWASGEGTGVVQGKVGAVVAFDGVTDAVRTVLSSDAKHESAFKKVFASIDEDGDGSISAEELSKHGEVMWGGAIDMDVIRMMVRGIDQGNGGIEFEEFRSHPGIDGMVEGVMWELEAFGALDKNGDGQIEGPELRKALKGLGEEIEKEDAKDFIAHGDKNGDEKVDYGEFVTLLHSEDFADNADHLHEILERNADIAVKEERDQKQVFDMIDNIEDGQITSNELGDYGESLLGERPSENETQGMIAELDLNDDVQVNFTEFKSHPATMGAVQGEMAVLEAYAAFDKDDNGTVGDGEVGKALERWGVNMSKDDIKGLIKKVDQDDDGVVSYEEFRRFMVTDENMAYEIIARQAEVEQTFDDDFKRVFDLIDKDGDGSITAEELLNYFDPTGEETSPEEVNMFMQQLDQGNGQIELEEFKSHPLGQSVVEPEMQLIATFSALDKDTDGQVGRGEMREALKGEGEEVSKEKVDGLFAQADENKKDGLDYREFKHFMMNPDKFPEGKGVLFAIMNGQNKQDDDALRRTFDQVDKNGDGGISPKEVGKWMASLHGDTPPPEALQGMVSEVDMDQNGLIEFEEFKAHEGIRSAAEFDMHVFETFGVFDTDQDSLVSKQEMQEGFSQWNEEVTEEDTAKFIAAADDDGDEKLNFEEFKKAFAQIARGGVAPPSETEG